MIQRLFISLLGFMLAIDFVAYAIWSNGGAIRTNPVWQFLLGLIICQKYCVGIATGVFVLWLINEGLNAAGSTKEKSKSETTLVSPHTAARSVEPSLPRNRERESKQEAIPATSPTKTTTTTTTLDELKQKAIEQIIRGY